MFQSARLKLTLWYLLIIMFISMIFSIVIYRGATGEIERSLRNQQFRIYRQQHQDVVFQLNFRPPADEQVLAEAKERIRLVLALVNLGIFFLAGAAGYFLAGRTLKPIKEVLDEQNRFVADASHELRTPLTVLKSEIEVYMRGKKHDLEEANNILKSNLEEVNNLQALSDNLIQLAQYQKPSDLKSFEKVSLQEIINTSEKKLNSFIQQKNILVVNKIKDFEISGNKDVLINLFIILIDNAVKYSPEKSKISILTKKTDHMIVVNISDEGIGISSKDIPHIFDRFYRADISRSKQKISGYGLGLSIAKKIVDNHNGTINVKSQEGKGTTFIVKLPSV